MRSAVPRTGKSALTPGNAVPSLKPNDATSSAIKPAHGSNRKVKIREGIKRRRAPIPNSQALVGSE